MSAILGEDCIALFGPAGLETTDTGQRSVGLTSAENSKRHIIAVPGRLHHSSTAFMLKRPFFVNLAGFCVHPFCPIFPARQPYQQVCRTAPIYVDSVRTPRLNQSTGGRLVGYSAFNYRIMRPHFHEVQAIHEILEYRQLLLQNTAPTARSIELGCAIFVTHGEGIVQVIKHGTARDQKVPGLKSVRLRFASGEAGLIIPNGSVQMVVFRYRSRRLGVMEIENRNVGVDSSTFFVLLAMFCAIRCFVLSFDSVSTMTLAICACHGIVTPPK